MRRITEEKLQKEQAESERAQNGAAMAEAQNKNAAARRKKKRVFADYVVIVVAAAVMAAMYDLFVMPNNFAPSGLNGAATMVEYITK